MPFIIPGISPDITIFLTTFLFTFAVFFGLLAFSKMFVSRDKEGRPEGKEPRGIWALISFVAGFATASYAPASAFLQQVIPPAAVFLTVIFFLVFVKQVLFGRGHGKEGQAKKNPWNIPILLAISLILLIAFSGDISTIASGVSPVGSDTLLYAGGIVIILAIFYYAGREA